MYSRILLLFNIIISLILTSSHLMGVGTNFLAIPATAEELALGSSPVMGRSFSVNPANQTWREGRLQLLTAYGNWYQGFNNSSFAVGWSRNQSSKAIRLRWMGNNELELRTSIPTDDPIAYWGSFGLSVDGVYGRKIGSVSYGLSFRYLFLQMHTENSSGVSINLGIKKQFGNKLNVGGAILNVGRMSKLLSEQPLLPLRIMLGTSYILKSRNISNTIGVSTEFNKAIQGSVLRIQNQVQWNYLYVRFGSEFSHNVNAISGGLGIQMGIYHVNYGIKIGSQDIGIPQMIDFSIDIP